MGSITAPFAASGPRSPTERPRAIPPAVRGAVLSMVYEGTDLCTAAKKVGIRGDTLRRWLHRPELVGFLRKERAAFRHALCAGNEHHLAQVRAGSNEMAKVRAIQVLEALSEGAALRSGEQPSPGVVLVIRHAPAVPEPPIDITPKPRIIDASQ